MCKTCGDMKDNNDVGPIIDYLDDLDDKDMGPKEIQCHRILNDYLSNLVVDSDARLVLARCADEIEPELYDGTGGYIADDYDMEGALNKVIDLQIRMDDCMKKIKLSNEAISWYFKNNKWMPAIWCAWSGKMEEGKAQKFLDNPLNERPIEWLEERLDLWTQWWKLKNECGDIAKEYPAVWPKYFQFIKGEEEDYDPLANKRECPELDNRMLVSDQAYFEGHQDEQEEFLVYN